MYYHEICRMEIGDFLGQVTEMLNHFIGGVQLSSTSGYDNCIARDQLRIFIYISRLKPLVARPRL